MVSPHEIDYDEIFSTVAMLKSTWIILAIVTYYNYEIWQMNIKTVFLNKKLAKNLYITRTQYENMNNMFSLNKDASQVQTYKRNWHS